MAKLNSGISYCLILPIEEHNISSVYRDKILVGDSSIV